MVVTDHEEIIQLNYAPEDVFKSLKSLLPKLKGRKGFKVEEVNENRLNMAFTANKNIFSWGESISVSVLGLENGLSKLFIRSTPRIGAIGSNVDMEKSKENIKLILNLLRESLKEYQEISQKQKIDDVVDQIKKLAELKEAGILTEEEFLTKKNQVYEKNKMET